jgi:glycogen operon protein
LLLDPYAREIVGEFAWHDEHFAGDRLHPGHMDNRDNAARALKARVPHDDFDWRGDRAPRTALTDSVLFECHVKGFSRLNEQIPESLRGTYAGLAHPASLAHLKRLGVTAVSLLPVHYALSEERLVGMGMSNYWGYNTIGFFCVDPRLASSANPLTARDEFRAMVRSLHQAGLEVLLDVVYNHTAESNESGPSISFRGLDNASYYRLKPDEPAHYENHSGCGNTLDIRHPRVLQLVLDSLRYWVSDMHVDGFRFDLAPVLGRGHFGFDRQGAFFTAVAQDPILSRVKMIAEPWDAGPAGYQVGGFPRGWLEWNDHFRDGMRRFWVQSAAAPDAPVPSCSRGDFALRLCASSDLYQARQRAPAESVNYVVSHDGFTLRDVVSYNQRHNLANGENNRDGHGHNLSFNCGVEGHSDAASVQALRARLQRALLATTLLAQGTPMLCAGDELGHTQGGNNNPYCQDNTSSWINWSAADAELQCFTERLVALRLSLLPFANHWYSGVADLHGLHDISWMNSDGTALQGAAWNDPMQRTLVCLIGKPGRSRVPLLLLVNASHAKQPFKLPHAVWNPLLDSSHPLGLPNGPVSDPAHYQVPAHALVLLQAA